ncbi:hypothetical protein BV898_19701, partial [Hypsibius exemplaris]
TRAKASYLRFHCSHYCKSSTQYRRRNKTYKDSTLKRYEILQLPPYLILNMKRFNNNTFFVEKNTTIVKRCCWLQCPKRVGIYTTWHEQIPQRHF